MIPDQADNLRRLASRSLPSDRSPRGRLTVLSGCKGGVGVTTLSLNLAVSFRAKLSRVLLIDGNPIRGDLAVMYRLQAEYDVDDVIAGHCDIRDAITLGPAGIQTIVRFGRRESMPPASCWQLLRQLEDVSHEFDQIIVDAGSCPAMAEVLWPAANDAIVVTSTEQVAITDAYALIKSMVGRNVQSNRVGFVINRHRDEARANDVQCRLASTCQQFLQLETEAIGCVPHDDNWEVALDESRSIACARPRSVSATAIHDIADRLNSGHFDTNHLNPVAIR